MTKLKSIAPAMLLALAASLTVPACTDDDNVGASISRGEVSIVVDSTFTVTGRSVRAERIDSRDGNLLIGHLSAADYGELEAAFTGRLMPAAELAIPDSIPMEDITGMSLRFSFNKTGFTGDTLAPQQLSVYALSKQLPDNIDNTFNPEGYYNPDTPLGSASYTASTLGVNAKSTSTGHVTVPLSADFARRVVTQYRTDPSVFQWPATFAQYFPGIFVKSTFGRGLVLNFTNTEFLTFWQYKAKTTKIVDGTAVKVDTLMCDTTSLFAISPEVLSVNLLRLKPAQSILDRIAEGRHIIQSPAGYNLEIDFPAQSILDKYMGDNFNLGVINTLTYTLPVTTPANDYDITAAPYLLMIKSSKLQEFFAQNKVPEEGDTDAFWAKYDGDKGQYVFNNMRPYIVSLMQAGDTVEPDDYRFTLVPVNITTETVGYGSTTKTVVTSCTPYLTHPTVCIADLQHSKVKFTYSRQVIL